MDQELTFDRFTQQAKLALFHARGAVSEHGGAAIAEAHLLLGLLKAAPELAPLLRPAVNVQRLSECLTGVVAAPSLPPTSAEVPFDSAVSLVMHNATRLADQFAHAEVTPAHMLQALLQQRSGRAVECLRTSGVDIDSSEAAVAKQLRGGSE